MSATDWLLGTHHHPSRQVGCLGRLHGSTALHAQDADPSRAGQAPGRLEQVKPLLLIDVDGVLNPFAMAPRKVERFGFETHHIADPSEPRRIYRVLLNPADGERLNALADRFELTWCTTWMRHANTEIGPRIGLPSLPVLAIDRSLFHPLLFWKTPQVAELTAGREFVWLDDDIGRRDRDWLSATLPQRHLAITTDPARGVLEAQWQCIAGFAE